MRIELENAGLYFAVDVDTGGRARLVHFSHRPAAEPSGPYHKYYTLLELHCIGADIDDHHGSRYTYTSPGAQLRYVSHAITRTEQGQLLTIELTDGKLDVTVFYQFFDGVPVARCWNRVVNRSQEPVTLAYDTSFAYYGLSDDLSGGWENGISFYIPHNTWHGELQWRKNTIWELGLSKLNRSSVKRLSYLQAGSWSSSEYLPMGVVENGEDHGCLFWQIEHNGSWYWECSDVPDGGLYLQLSGPNNDQHQFRKVLCPGDSFESVPAAVGVSLDGFDGAIGALTRYRRLIRRSSRDNDDLPVIFNDYMNCLMGDTSEERLLPLIDAAAAVGSEYFVIDAGWFSRREGGDDAWWSSIGIWEEAPGRFPHGLRFVTDAIRAKGMLPGIWIEPECIGPDSPLASTLPDDWFFQLGGKRIRQHNRYQLDFRQPGVRELATRAFEHLIDRYGIGYFKMDYNINAGLGTDRDCDSPGDGLLEHNRALLGWLDNFLTAHPDIVLENCASGGMRMDYAMLQRFNLQSTSDQTDYRQYAAISSMAATAVAPEQGAVWSYPSPEGDEEEAVFNMINAMLGRVHQSGFLYRLPAASLRRVEEGIRCYKSIRSDIREGLPIFPLGLVHLRSPWAAGGLRAGKHTYLSVWRKNAQEDTLRVPLPHLKGKQARAELLYPAGLPVSYTFDSKEGVLTVTLPRTYTARFFRLLSD